MDTETAELVDGILKKAERRRAIEAAVIALRQRPKRNFHFLNLVQAGFWIWISTRVDFTATIEGKRVLLLEGALIVSAILLITASVIMPFVSQHKRHDRPVLLLAEEVLHLKEELKATGKS